MNSQGKVQQYRGCNWSPVNVEKKPVVEENTNQDKKICILPLNITIKSSIQENGKVTSSMNAIDTALEQNINKPLSVQFSGQSSSYEIAGKDAAVDGTDVQSDSTLQQLPHSHLSPYSTSCPDSYKSRHIILQPTVTKRPKIYIKRDIPKRTIRTVTLELIEKNPAIHLGVRANYLPLLKNTICSAADISLVEMYLTIKKLKQNEDFSLLAEYFEMSEMQVQNIFVHNLVKLARFMTYLISWPKNQSHYERHRNLPFPYRKNLSTLQNMVECVETDMRIPLHVDCSNFKFILSINTSSKCY